MILVTAKFERWVPAFGDTISHFLPELPVIAQENL
jgi:hypothetical protein